MTTVSIYRARVSGDTGASVDDLVKAGTIRLEKVSTIEVPRKPEWLGW
jgi:branched-chain amino acid transport system substrate-binding protein